ncbi:MAG: hypothetical protein ACL7AX_06175 [Candidatus Arsenophonus phytopathogenicus]
MGSIEIKSIELNVKQTDISDVLFHQNNPNNHTSDLQQTLNQIIDAIASFYLSTNNGAELMRFQHHEYKNSVFLVPNNLG